MRNLILVQREALPAKQVYGRDLAIKNYRQQLGISQGDVYWDASGGLQANAFAAIAGTIQNNHNLYLYLPENYPNGDPDHLQMMDYGRPISSAKSYFNQRLTRLLTQPLAPITAVKNTLTTFKLTPQVVLGKRGRGKSTWLAEKIRWLIHNAQNQPPEILLVTTFAAHRQRIMSLLSNDDIASITTIPPDEACRLLPAADYLIIDEAANLPAKQLLTLTKHYPHFSLASSEDGYEGSGRFFSLQTLPTLKAQYPALEIITLHTGQRFSAQDPLERRIEQIFFPQSVQQLSHQKLSALTIKLISQETLLQDEWLLGQIYQLLFQGHYRTQPADLKRLLDLPDQYIIAAFTQAIPIAVMHVLVEHPLKTELATKVMNNTRRPQGRLLMQQLLLHTQQLEYALAPIARIQRIVTQHNFRRQGVASRLIDYGLTHIPYQFGVSYGATENLESFWAAQGFITAFRSQKRNARNGRYNIIQLHKK